MTARKDKSSCEGLGLCFAVFVVIIAFETMVAIGNFAGYPAIELIARVAGTILAAITVVLNIYEQLFVPKDRRTKTFGRYAGELFMFGASHVWFFFPDLISFSQWVNVFVVANFFYGQPERKK